MSDQNGEDPSQIIREKRTIVKGKKSPMCFDCGMEGGSENLHPLVSISHTPRGVACYIQKETKNQTFSKLTAYTFCYSWAPTSTATSPESLMGETSHPMVHFFVLTKTIHPASKADISLITLSPRLAAWSELPMVTTLARPDAYLV